MPSPTPICMHYSGGKDATLALYRLQQDPQYQVKSLLTTITKEYRRVTMHGVREALLNAQAEALGLPLHKLYLPDMPEMDAYNRLMGDKLMQLHVEGIQHFAYGDIFLEDLKAYREHQLDQQGLKAVFPLWKEDTRKLAEEFIAKGFKAVVVSHNAQLMDESFAGRLFNQQFLDDLPGEVDPCGENGEFHTFVFDGPNFKAPIPYQTGETVYREYPGLKDEDGNTLGQMGFWFCDISPVK